MKSSSCDPGARRGRVSVIVPNRNHAHFLPICLEGIARQQRPPDEVVFVDDASTDESLDVVQTVAASFPCLKVLRQPEQRGVNETINRGLRESSGDLVVVTAADDRLLPAFLTRAAALMERYATAGICSGRSYVTDEVGIRIGELPLPPLGMVGDFHLSPERARSVAHRYGGWMTTNVTMFRRVPLLRAGGFDDRLGSYADAFAALELACRYGACFADEYLGEWRSLATGYAATSARDPATIAQVLEAARARLKRLRTEGFPAPLTQRWECRLRYVLSTSALRGDIGDPGALRDVLGAIDMTLPGPVVAACRVDILRVLLRSIIFSILRPFDLRWRVQAMVEKGLGTRKGSRISLVVR